MCFLLLSNKMYDYFQKSYNKEKICRTTAVLDKPSSNFKKK